jgi:hypothetical protein
MGNSFEHFKQIFMLIFYIWNGKPEAQLLDLKVDRKQNSGSISARFERMSSFVSEIEFFNARLNIFT